jgi:hypothetical protein
MEVFSGNGYTTNINDFFVQKLAVNNTMSYLKNLYKIMGSYEKNLNIQNYKDELEKDSRGICLLNPKFKFFKSSNDKFLTINFLNKLYKNYMEIKGENGELNDKNAFFDEYLQFMDKNKNDLKDIYYKNKYSKRFLL